MGETQTARWTGHMRKLPFPQVSSWGIFLLLTVTPLPTSSDSSLMLATLSLRVSDLSFFPDPLTWPAFFSVHPFFVYRVASSPSPVYSSFFPSPLQLSYHWWNSVLLSCAYLHFSTFLSLILSPLANTLISIYIRFIASWILISQHGVLFVSPIIIPDLRSDLL